MSKLATLTRTYTLWTFDTWGNARDGFEVNDRSKSGTVSINCKREVFNVGTESEFATYLPTDRQLAKALGARGCEFEWADFGFYVNDKRNGKPLGELVLIDEDE